MTVCSLIVPALRAQRAGQRPGLLADRARFAAELVGLAARGGAVEGALGNALHDRRQPEQAVDHVEFPVGGATAAGALAIGGDILVLARDAERCKIDAG